MDIMASISLSLELMNRLKEVGSFVKETEIKTLFAELQSELANVKIEASNLKIELSILKEENLKLKNSLMAKPKIRNGAYIFPEDNYTSSYCTTCYDVSHNTVKVRLTPNHVGFGGVAGLKCPSCKNVFIEYSKEPTGA